MKNQSVRQRHMRAYYSGFSLLPYLIPRTRFFPPLNFGGTLLALAFASLSFFPVAPALAEVTDDSLSQVSITRNSQGAFDGRERSEFVARASHVRFPLVSIILTMDWVPEGYLTDEQILSQRELISRLQAEVLSVLPEPVSRDAIRHPYIPVLGIHFSAPALRALLEVPQVSRIEVNAPNHRIALSTTVPQIEANHVHNRGGLGSGQVVAVIDTGVTAHPSGMLNGKVVGEACFSIHGNGWTSQCFGGTQPGVTTSTAAGSAVACGSIGDCAHGTRMAGVVIGVAPGAGIYAIQAASKYGSDISIANPNTASALQHIYSVRNQYNFAAVNMSFGTEDVLFTSACSPYYDIWYAAALVRSVGIQLIGATGNGPNGGSGSTTGISHPACLQTVTAVGGVLLNGNPSTTDTPWSGANRNALLELWAPGDGGNVLSVGTDGNGAYTGATSAAAAHVSGAVAAIRSIWNGDIIGSLKSSGRPVTVGGITRPTVRMDLAVPPLWSSISSYMCYGWTDVYWGSVPWGSSPANPFYQIEVQQVGSSGWTAWTTASTGATSTFIDVPYNSYVRVRSCDGSRCGQGTTAPGAAPRYQNCL